MRNASRNLIAATIFCSLTVSCRQTDNQPKQEVRAPDPSSSSVASERAIPAPQPDNRPVIVAFGDSLTAGVAGRSYPDHLQDLLDAKGFQYRVDNQGVSGDTSTDGLARIGNVIAAQPELVLMDFGGNDGLRGVPVTATRRNMDEIVSQLQARQIPIVLLGITLPPNYGPDYVKPFTAMFQELATEHHLLLMPFLLQHVYQNPSLMQPDGIHPNGDGNKIVAQDVLKLIEPTLLRLNKQR